MQGQRSDHSTSPGKLSRQPVLLLLLLVCTRHTQQVPWQLVAQLEAAGVSGLRIISPAVLRPLLRAQQQPVISQQAHPFVNLTATQALQLLEYCCSDLTAPDERRTTSGDGGSSSSGRGRSGGTDPPAPPAAADAGRQAGGPAVDVASVQASLPANVPQGAATVVADVFGPAGLAVLGGLATQMQQRLVTGVDDVLNAVMDAMGPAGQDASGQQQQEGGQRAAAAAATQQAATPPAAPPATAASTAAAAEAAGTSTQGAVSPVNLNKVPYLRGLPVPTAGGTIAVLGVANLFVFPPECCPAPSALMPAHLLRQFVAPECMEALSWLFRYPEVRQQLRLTFYGLDQLAAHLKEALGPTWTFAEAARDAAGSFGAPSQTAGVPGQRATAVCMAGTPGFPAVVVWDDGAAGGPYVDWLKRLWQVILQTVAAKPEWEVSISASTTAGSGTVGTAGSGRPAAAGLAAAGVSVEGFRTAAQRARGLAEAFAGEVAQAFNAAGPGGSSGAAAAAALGGGAAAPGASGAPAQQQESDALWHPLLDWPLVPLADGRLLKLRYRELALVVLPEYQQGSRPAVWDNQESCEQVGPQTL